MLSLLSALVGFCSSFLPEVMKYFQRGQDNKHELELLQLQIEANKQQSAAKLDEITTQGNVSAELSEIVEIHKPQVSFGAQLLDAAHEYASTTWGKFLIAPAFYTYVALDFISGLVRPLITYAIVVLYIGVKWAQYNVALASNTAPQALISIWTEQDFAVLTLVLGFWFGARLYKNCFGGSTRDSKKN